MWSLISVKKGLKSEKKKKKKKKQNIYIPEMLVTDVVTGKYIDEAQPLKVQPA